MINATTSRIGTRYFRNRRKPAWRYAPAAHRAGLTTVLLPRRNEPGLDDVPESVRSDLTVHLVSDVREVLDLALEPARTPLVAAPTDRRR